MGIIDAPGRNRNLFEKPPVYRRLSLSLFIHASGFWIDIFKVPEAAA
jgi:hypothetical protein